MFSNNTDHAAAQLQTGVGMRGIFRAEHSGFLTRTRDLSFFIFCSVTFSLPSPGLRARSKGRECAAKAFHKPTSKIGSLWDHSRGREGWCWRPSALNSGSSRFRRASSHSSAGYKMSFILNGSLLSCSLHPQSDSISWCITSLSDYTGDQV